MRLLLGLCLMVLLGGCNVVVTDQPLFFPSVEPGAPKLRNGLWVIEDPDKTDCGYDARKPVTRWPDCAEWMLVREGELLAYDAPGKGDRAGVGAWNSMPFVLSAGEPMVLQFDGSDDGGPAFQYFGVVAIGPTQTQLSAIKVWPVLCGPPPPADAMTDGKRRYVTLEPLPGLTVTDNSGCTATEASAVRNAAAWSRDQAAKDSNSARWIRDTYP
jgi:hypothetical protein